MGSRVPFYRGYERTSGVAIDHDAVAYGQRLQRLGGPSGDDADDLLMESMDDVNRAFDELIHED